MLGFMLIYKGGGDPAAVSYNATASAGEKGSQCQAALRLLEITPRSSPTPSATSYNVNASVRVRAADS